MPSPVEVFEVTGFIARCLDCGWQGQFHGTRNPALMEAATHRGGCLGTGAPVTGLQPQALATSPSGRCIECGHDWGATRDPEGICECDCHWTPLLRRPSTPGRAQGGTDA